MKYEKKGFLKYAFNFSKPDRWTSGQNVEEFRVDTFVQVVCFKITRPNEIKVNRNYV